MSDERNPSRWSHPTLLPQSSLRGAAGAVLLAAVFWFCAFLIGEARSILRDELPFHVAGGHRAAAFGFGALLALASASILKRIGSETRKQAVFAGVAVLFMPPLHAVFFFLTCKVAPIPGIAPMTIGESVEKGLFATGYFIAWVALQLALAYHRQVQETRAPALTMEAAAPQAKSPIDRRYWASCGSQRVCIQPGEIRWIEAQKDYVILHCAARNYIMRMTLSALAAELAGDDFVQVHRSAVVRRSLVASMHRKPTGALVLKTTCGAVLPVGRSYAHVLHEQADEDFGHTRTSVA